MNRTRWIFAVALAAFAPASLAAQAPRPETDRPVDAATRASVIENVLAALDRAYVFPEKSREMANAIRQRARRREYDAIGGSIAFADSLTAHLQAVSRDRHLRVRFSPEVLPPPDTVERRETAEERARRRERTRLGNFGFEKVERMAGNVGYIEIRGFQDPALGAETAAAAMTFLANTDALIIDLRRNGGGSPGMVQLVSSYLFDEPTHLNSLYFRPTNRTDQFWTLPYVPGQRFGREKPVYVLTSRRTFSAAEEFTYNLQNLRRATVVGDTTGGGAHPGGTQRVGDHFLVFVPSGRAINPISGTNWEGTGVRPDIPAATEEALATAYMDALGKILEKTTSPDLRRQLQELVAEQRRELERMRAAPPAGS